MLGRGVDELDIDLLGLPGFGSWEDRFSHDDWSLSGTHDTTLNKKEVLVHLSVVWESTKRSDVLLNGISFAHGVVSNTVSGCLSDSIDLLVKVSSGMVTQLTTTSDGPFNCRWMPRSNTRDLSDTSM